MAGPLSGLALALVISGGYWLLYRRARWEARPLLRVPPAPWLRMVELVVQVALGLGALLPLGVAPFHAGLEPTEVVLPSLTFLVVMAGFRVVFRSAELTATRQGIRLFIFRVAWSEVEEVALDERFVRIRAPRRHRGLRSVEVPISDLGWQVTPEVRRRLRLLHRCYGPARARPSNPSADLDSPHGGWRDATHSA